MTPDGVELPPEDLSEVRMPHAWTPREYQQPLWKFMCAGGKRAVAVWHRRSGKDLVAVNWAAKAACARVGVYWHMLPKQKQARKVIWEKVELDGRRLIDQAFPSAIRANRGLNNTEMSIRLKNGSMWQLCGSDMYDNLVGANPVGIVFSEYSIAKPSAWDYLRPILVENNGWAMFLFTPRGHNHGFDLFQTAQANPESWFSELRTRNETGAITDEEIDKERREGMTDEMIEQEYYCSFTAAIMGAYFGKQMAEAEKEGRITSVPYDRSTPVHTAWDLGMSDSTVIWFVQATPGGELHAIDYLESSGEGMEYYADALKARGYIYGRHYAPHDVEVRELGTGKTRREVARNFGIDFEVVPAMNPMERVQATRSNLSRFWFDREKTKAGREALLHYRREYDEQRKCFKDHPEHDWSCHAADAFGHFNVAFKKDPGVDLSKKLSRAFAAGGSSAWMGA